MPSRAWTKEQKENWSTANGPNVYELRKWKKRQAALKHFAEMRAKEEATG